MTEGFQPTMDKGHSIRPLTVSTVMSIPPSLLSFQIFLLPIHPSCGKKKKAIDGFRNDKAAMKNDLWTWKMYADAKRVPLFPGHKFLKKPCIHS